MAVKRKLNSVTQKVGKHKRRGKKLAPAQKLKARKAYALYKKRSNSRDKKFDTVRAAFRAGKRKGRPNKAGKKSKLASKSTALRRKAGSIAKKGKLGKKDARKLKDLRSGAKKVYSGNRKRIQMSAKDKAHEIAGQAVIAANKLIADAKKTGNPKKIAAAKKAAHKILVKAKNQAVQVIQDTRRDLTTMRKNAGRSKTKKVTVSKKSGKGKHKMLSDISMSGTGHSLPSSLIRADKIRSGRMDAMNKAINRAKWIRRAKIAGKVAGGGAAATGLGYAIYKGYKKYKANKAAKADSQSTAMVPVA